MHTTRKQTATMCEPTSKIITCKAAVSWGVGEAVKVEKIQVDPPKSSEVRIKMLCASLCHTDILCCNGCPVGIGMAVLIGAGNKTSGEINFLPLLCGRTLKGTIYGGIKTKSDLPILFDKCLKKERHLDELWTHEVCLDEMTKHLR